MQSGCIIARRSGYNCSMTTKLKRAASTRLRGKDAAALDAAQADAQCALRTAAPAPPAVGQALGNLSAIKRERQRRAAGLRGDESWVTPKWLEGHRIPQGAGMPDAMTKHKQPPAVVLTLRDALGKDADGWPVGFNRFYGYDSPRWDAEVARHVGNVQRDTAQGHEIFEAKRGEIAARDFCTTWLPDWANKVRAARACDLRRGMWLPSWRIRCRSIGALPGPRKPRGTRLSCSGSRLRFMHRWRRSSPRKMVARRRRRRTGR